MSIECFGECWEHLNCGSCDCQYDCEKETDRLKVFPDELKKLLAKFGAALSEAQDARQDVLGYLEDNYDIDICYYDGFEDELEWCYGFNERDILKVIKEKKNEISL